MPYRPLSRLRRLPIPRLRRSRVLALLCAAGVPGTFAPNGLAQTAAPDAGSLLRESQQQAPRLPALPPPEAPRVLVDPGVKTLVTRFDIEGSSRYSGDQLHALFADLYGTELGFAGLQAAADRIASFYRLQGLHATAFLPEQTLTGGAVRIVVVEGRYGQLKLDVSPAARPLPSALVERMLARGQQSGELLDSRALERATLLANEVPGVRVSSVLTAGTAPGQTDVLAKVDERAAFSGSATLDNHDARATGPIKLGVGLAWAGPLAMGDELQLQANATRGKKLARLAWTTALGSNGLRGGINASTMRYELVGDFAASGGEGSARTVGAALSYPIVRGVERNLFSSLTLERRHLRNDSTAGPLSDKVGSTLAFALNGDALDTLGGGGATLGGIVVTVGELDLSGNAADQAADAAGPQREGGFAKFSMNLARLQRLSEAGSLWLSFSGQRAAKNLDSGEKFSIGGPYAVRAYPALEGSGDHGWLATAEYRHRFNAGLQGALFYDHGAVSQEKSPAAGAALNHVALKGVGVSAEWSIQERASLRAAIATRIGSNPLAGANGQDSDGTRRRPQFWLSALVPF